MSKNASGGAARKFIEWRNAWSYSTYWPNWMDWTWLLMPQPQARVPDDSKSEDGKPGDPGTDGREPVRFGKLCVTGGESPPSLAA